MAYCHASGIHYFHTLNKKKPKKIKRMYSMYRESLKILNYLFIYFIGLIIPYCRKREIIKYLYVQ